jgi:hypothetical protein
MQESEHTTVNFYHLLHILQILVGEKMSLLKYIKIYR